MKLKLLLSMLLVISLALTFTLFGTGCKEGALEIVEEEGEEAVEEEAVEEEASRWSKVCIYLKIKGRMGF